LLSTLFYDKWARGQYLHGVVFKLDSNFKVLLINNSIFFVLGDSNLTLHSLAMLAPISTINLRKSYAGSLSD
jgi:flagellar motor switch/type III secretory pathway protein FliN